jgi:hypothetical protein
VLFVLRADLLDRHGEGQEDARRCRRHEPLRDVPERRAAPRLAVTRAEWATGTTVLVTIISPTGAFGAALYVRAHCCLDELWKLSRSLRPGTMMIAYAIVNDVDRWVWNSTPRRRKWKAAVAA